MAEKSFDVVVIGGGPGGYLSAIRASQLGLHTALVEKESLGGVCLNWGCIPTKALLRNAEVLRLVKNAKDYGITTGDISWDYEAAYKRSRQVSNRLVRGVGFLMKKNQIAVFDGEASFLDGNRVQVAPSGEILSARNFIIATGARPRMLPGLEIDHDRVIGSRDALGSKALPEEIVIVGAGAIGTEFATIYAAYGVKVTLLEMMPQVLPLEDEDTAKEVAKALKKQGVDVRTNAKVTGIERLSDKAVVSVDQGGESATIEAEKVLVAIGVQGNSDGIGLEKVGVRVERSFIPVDSHMRTNVPHIYAIGDVTGKLLLAHVAYAHGRIAAEVIAGAETVVVEDHRFVPRAVYSHPQVASLGLTEKQAREEYGDKIRVGTFPFQANGKALALNEREGFVKIIADSSSGEILGAHIVGPEAADLIPELALARSWELTPEEIARTIHVHPSLPEAVMEAAEGVFGRPMHI